MLPLATVMLPISNSVITTNNRDVTASDSDVTITNTNITVDSSNDDVTTSNKTWGEREEEDCSTISKLKRTNELQSIKENELLNTITELNSKLKSLQESRSQQIDNIVSEREQYKMERDELQRKLNNVTDVSVSDNQNRVDVSIPSDNAWQPVNHNDIKVTYNCYNFYVCSI